MALTAKEIDDAWGIMGATNAGKNARLRLLEVLNGLCPHVNNPSALLGHEGRRTLARELLTLLDAGMTNAGPGNSPDDHTSNTRAGFPVSGRRSYRRVTAESIKR